MPLPPTINRVLLLLLLLLTCAHASNSPTFYVSRHGGSDSSGDGKSRATAFASLTKCVKTAPAGATCVLGGGRYDREAAYPVELPHDIEIVGDPEDAAFPVLDGSVRLNTTWSQKSTTQQSCVWTSAPLQIGPVYQLWSDASSAPPTPSPAFALDGLAPLTPARFPNAKLSDDSVFDGAPFSVSGRTNGSLLYSTKDSKPGRIVDDGTHKSSLASSALDFTGTIAVLPLGTMGSATQGVAVKQHKPGQAFFTYTPPAGTVGKGHLNNPYFFEGSCSLLDAEGEWCWDTQQKRISVWLDGCAAPSSAVIRAKTTDYLLKVTTRRTAVTLRRLALWGGTVDFVQANVVLDEAFIFHPAANRYVLGATGDAALPAPTLLEFNQGAGSISATNTTWEWAQASQPLDRLGKQPYFSDCSFLRATYALGEVASLGDGGMSTGLVFQHSQIRLFNSFSGLTPGLEATVAYNDVSHGFVDVDGAGVHVHIKPQNGAVLYRNWAHDLVIKAFRFDRVNSATATWGTNGTVLENVAWRSAAACFKGDFHTIANNTIFASSDDAVTAALFVMMFDPTKSWAIKGENAHTRLQRNAADSIFNVSDMLPGIHSGNIGNAPIAEMLKNIDAAPYDFRPRPGSKLATAGAGAYASPEAEMWVPGPRGAGGGSSGVSCASSAACAVFWERFRSTLPWTPASLSVLAAAGARHRPKKKKKKVLAYHLGSRENGDKHCFELQNYVDKAFRRKGYVNGPCEPIFDTMERKDAIEVCPGRSQVNVKDCKQAPETIFVVKRGRLTTRGDGVRA